MLPASAASKPTPSAGQMMLAYFKDFGVLRETRKEYWAIQIINFLDCTFYFALVEIATIFLSQDLGLTDKQAGFSYALFSSGVSLLLFVSGLFTDWLGIKKSLNLSMGAMLLLRVGVVLVTVAPGVPHKGLLVSALLVLMSPFMAAIQTIFQSACKRFTSRRSRSAGFNLWYLFMNIGAALGGFMIDIIRLRWHLPDYHIFTMGIITGVLCLVIGLTLIQNEEQVMSPGETAEPTPAAAPGERKSPWRTFLDVLREPPLWRLLVLVTLIVGVRAVYLYNLLLMPKYWLRVIGEGAMIGTLNAINPIGIVIGLILFIPLANRFQVFSMLVYGAMISSFALVPLALPWHLFSADIVKAHYLMSLVCMVILTVGEIIWSPKLYEYTAAIAPKGQEGVFLGLSLLPYFVAKTGISASSGYLLGYWSPETVWVKGVKVPLKQALIDGQVPYWQSPAAMWLVLGAYAFAGCVIALLLRGWLTRGAQWKAPDQQSPA